MTHLSGLPRLADVTLGVSAAESTLGWKPGTFVQALEANHAGARSVLLENSTVGEALIAFVAHRQTWTGSAKELLRALEHFDSEAVTQSGWPRNVQQLTAALDRLQPTLQRTGVQLRHH